MKILIDEQLPTKLKYLFATEYETYTVRDMKWLGTKNGELLRLMQAHSLNILITNDKNLYYQQKIDSLNICVLNINSKTNRYEHVLEKMSFITLKLQEINRNSSKSAGLYFVI